MRNHHLNVLAFDLDEIVSIEPIGEKESIDIVVDNTRMFWANDIYTHNSGFNAEINDEQSIGKAIEPFQVADWVVTFAQPADYEADGFANATLLKNRLGPKGLVVKVHYNPNQGIFRQVEKLTKQHLYDSKARKEVQSGLKKGKELLDLKIQEMREKKQKISENLEQQGE